MLKKSTLSFLVYILLSSNLPMIGEFVQSKAHAESLEIVVTNTSAIIDGNIGSVSMLKAEPGPLNDPTISFMEALKAVNNTGPGYTIRFDPSLKGKEIDLPTPTLALTDKGYDNTAAVLDVPFTTIDGDVDGNSKPDIMLKAFDWTIIDNKLWYIYSLGINSDHNVIKNLAISGIVIDKAGAFENKIIGNYVGLTLESQSRGHVASGINIGFDAHHNVVEGNHIAGLKNDVGGTRGRGIGVDIYENANNNILKNNWIGISPDGAAIPNDIGVMLELGAHHNLIGGSRSTSQCEETCNVISGNSVAGIYITDPNTKDNQISGNYIGVNAAGTGALPNGVDGGVFITNQASYNVIGGLRGTSFCQFECNLISGNAGPGVFLKDPGTMQNKINGNYIGTGIDGIAAFPNIYGILILDGPSKNTVGSVDVAEPYSCAPNCNVIRHNRNDGVAVSGPDSIGNSIRGNEIGENEGLGINLAGSDVSNDNKVTPNDVPNDSDSGPNDLMNFPTGVAAHYNTKTAKTTVSGWLDHSGANNAVVDVYAVKTLDPGGFGEGERYLGSTKPSKDGAWRLELNGQLPTGYSFVSATATSASGSTSEFSAVCGDPDRNGNPDNDGDTLCDDWEKKGIDYNGDGFSDILLTDANPDRPDIYVDVDYMVDNGNGPSPNLNDPTFNLPHSHKPKDEALAEVIDAFDRNGVSLHITPGEEMEPIAEDGNLGNLGILPISDLSSTPGAVATFADLKMGKTGSACGEQSNAHFGTQDDRKVDQNHANCENILGALRLSFRYAIFGHHIAEEYDPNALVGHTGVAESSGNDFFIALGFIERYARDVANSFKSATPQEIQKIYDREVIDLQAATFMHELGHTLGLGHGGTLVPSQVPFFDANYKPNYFSVMNYAYQFNGRGKPAKNYIGEVDSTGQVRVNRPLDYSKGTALPLKELELNEFEGIVVPQAGWPNVLFQSKGVKYVAPAEQGIDWNMNGIPEEDTMEDLNNDGIVEEMLDHDDWRNLDYDFRGSVAKGDAQFGKNNEPELTNKDYLTLILGDDFDDDGTTTRTDNCPVISNPGQEDSDGDSIGDACSLANLSFQSKMPVNTVNSATVTLYNPAPVGGVHVVLESSDPAIAEVPSIVTIPAGGRIATFDISSKQTKGVVTISAHFGSSALSQELKVIVNVPSSTSPISYLYEDGGEINQAYDESLNPSVSGDGSTIVSMDNNCLTADCTYGISIFSSDGENKRIEVPSAWLPVVSYDGQYILYSEADDSPWLFQQHSLYLYDDHTE
ncbi:hypothetical protein DL346_16035 [Paenibacillus montanisoli]|uniref:Right handed beta helix domain-containing protein n=1 Tax=Paenibacillus montanisoli TaxID=2081970 RepID=A0A328U4I8_9BACL|nr:right-handed parallel beta-helix repeat-containing protein [Paenibacillus montanisoli]RAP74914.1 hypothetical protein DL346_16035 [Paenibacillus montanisoli]